MWIHHDIWSAQYFFFLSALLTTYVESQPFLSRLWDLTVFRHLSDPGAISLHLRAVLVTVRSALADSCFCACSEQRRSGVCLSALEDGPKIGCLSQGWLAVEAPLNYPATVEGWEEKWLITPCQENGKRGIFCIGMGPSGRWLGLVRPLELRRWCREQEAWLGNERLGIPAGLHKHSPMRGKLSFNLHEKMNEGRESALFTRWNYRVDFVTLEAFVLQWM